MMVSQAFNSSMLLASFSGGTSRPMSGPLPPTLEVVKNTGAMWSKSRSSFMRPISTEPTMPRQPISPTFIIFVSRKSVRASSTWAARPKSKRLHHRVAHLAARHLLRAFGPDVARAQALCNHLLHRALDAVGGSQVGKRVAVQHRDRQDGRQRIREIPASDIGRRAVDRLVHALVVLVERG